MSSQCSQAPCTARATRQTYGPEWSLGDPWNPAGFVPWCSDHAPADSWPLIEPDGRTADGPTLPSQPWSTDLADLERFEVRVPEDELKRDDQLTCTICGAVLCDIEPDDTLATLCRVASTHVCPGGTP